jgi:hypothetical protein
VVISANAVQAAPVGLAVTISTAALLAGTTISTTVTATAIKTITMTTLQKTLVTATVAILAGAGIYEAHQASQQRQHVLTMQQQQVLQAEQTQQLQHEYEDATNRLASIAEEKANTKANNEELLKLRGKVGVLHDQVSESSQKLATVLSSEAKFEAHRENRCGETICNGHVRFFGEPRQSVSNQSYSDQRGVRGFLPDWGYGSTVFV